MSALPAEAPPRISGRRGTFTTGDGAILRVADSGPATAPVTVVMTHGWSLDHTSWHHVSSKLPASAGVPVRTVRYDHRGHGESTPGPAGSASLPRLADDLAELILDRVPTGRLILTGHSMGGMVVMALAERYPDLVQERVAGVAFVATSAGHLPALPPWLRERATKALLSPRLERRRPARPPRPALMRPGLRLTLFGKQPLKTDLDLVIAQLGKADPGSVRGCGISMTEHERLASLAAFADVPAVVFAGSRDRLTPLPHARRIAAALPHAEFISFPKAGHMLTHERTDEITDYIADLVRRAA